MSAPREILDYRDLESKLHDAVNMSEVACDMIEQAQCSANHYGGSFHLTDNEMNLVSFSVYHANKLVCELKSKWDEVHESNVAARNSAKGGAA